MGVFSAIAATFNFIRTALLFAGGGALGSTLAGTIAATTAAAVITGAVVYGVGRGVARAMAPDFPSGTTGLNGGTRQQLAPNTGYRVPVVYGHAFQQGIITDAAISSDNQTMTYVLTLGEKTSGTTTLGNVFFNDKRLVFNGSTASVTSTVDEDGTSSTDFAGNVEVYVWDGDGDSANALRGSVDAHTLVDHWTSTEKNSNTIFSVVKVTYDPESQLTGLGTMTYELTNSLDNPANVIVDYLNSDIYGAGISNADIDMNAISDLHTYSNELITYTDKDGASATQKRYTMNGVANTGEDCRTNLDRMLTACNSFFTFDPKQGKWKVTANKAESIATLASAFVFNDDNIVSDIKLTTTALGGSYNSVEVEFPDKEQKDKNNYTTITLPSNLREANEPDNEMSIRMEFVNNNVQAEYLANQQLRQTREDLVAQFTADFSAIQVDAGDVIKLYETEIYGQNNKLYRVMKTVEKETEDGMILVDVTALEYNADVYTVEPITEFTPADNSDISLFNRLGQTTTPTVDNERSLLSLPVFDVNTNTPSSGIYDRAELWYSVASNFSNSHLLMNKTTPSTFGNGTEIEFTVRGLPTGTYYYRTRAGNEQGYGAFSSTSSAHNWTANVQINPVTIIDSNDPVFTVDGNLNITMIPQSISNAYLDASVVTALGEAANITIPEVAGYFYFDSTGNTNAPSTSAFNTQVGRNPINNDVVVVTNTSNTEQQAAYIHNGTSFGAQTDFISGGLVTDGTIGANKIVANSIDTSLLSFTPITEIAGQTGATISSAQLSSGGLQLTSDSIATSRLSGSIPVSQGGTGETSITNLTATLAANGLRLTANTINVSEITGTLPESKGGTGVTSRSAAYTADGVRLDSQTVPFSDVTGTVPENQGGTGTTSFSSALTAQGVGFVSGSNANLGDLATLDDITLAKVTNAGSLAALNSVALNGGTTTGTLPSNKGGTGTTTDSAFVSSLTSQNLVLASFNGSPVTGGDLTAATVISAGSLLVADTNVTRNSNGGITSINGGIINTGTLNASLVNVTNLNANNITAGQLTANRIDVTDLVLESEHNVVSGFTIGPWYDNTMRLLDVAIVGYEPGFYQGYVRIWGGTGQVKTASIVIGDGTYGSGSSYQLRNDIQYTNNSSTPTLPLSSTTSGGTSTGYAQYHSTAAENWSSIARFSSTNSVAQLTVMFRKTSANTVPTRMYILAQGDGGPRYLQNVEYSFHRLTET